MNTDIYTSIEQVEQLLAERGSDENLKKKIEDELGDNLISIFKNSSPLSVAFRQLCSPDNGFVSFYERSQQLKLKPAVLEYHQDLFVHFNEEKKGLGRLRLRLEEGTPVMVDIINFFDNEKKKLGEATLKDGEKLVEFHHRLFPIAGYTDVVLFDNSQWFKNFKNASEYYYYLLLHFVCHGVLFETFIIDPEDSEGEFTRSVILPALQRIYENFGVQPLIIQQYPDIQTKEEDFYWWCYPNRVNDYLIKYSLDRGLDFKRVSLTD